MKSPGGQCLDQKNVQREMSPHRWRFDVRLVRKLMGRRLDYVDRNTDGGITKSERRQVQIIRRCDFAHYEGTSLTIARGKRRLFGRRCILRSWIKSAAVIVYHRLGRRHPVFMLAATSSAFVKLLFFDPFYRRIHRIDCMPMVRTTPAYSVPKHDCRRHQANNRTEHMHSSRVGRLFEFVSAFVPSDNTARP